MQKNDPYFIWIGVILFIYLLAPMASPQPCDFANWQCTKKTLIIVFIWTREQRQLLSTNHKSHTHCMTLWALKLLVHFQRAITKEQNFNLGWKKLRQLCNNRQKAKTSDMCWKERADYLFLFWIKAKVIKFNDDR